MPVRLTFRSKAVRNFYRAGRNFRNEPVPVKEVTGINRYTRGMYSYLEFKNKDDALAFVLRWG